MIRMTPAAMNSSAVARSGSRRLAAFAVAFLLVLLENGPRGHFFGALAISSFFLGRLEDVLVLALLFGSDAAYMFAARQNCPPDGCSLSGTRPRPTLLSPHGGEGPRAWVSRPGSCLLGSTAWPALCSPSPSSPRCQASGLPPRGPRCPRRWRRPAPGCPACSGSSGGGAAHRSRPCAGAEGRAGSERAD